MKDERIWEWAQQLDDRLTAAMGIDAQEIIESAARELVNEALEEAAKVCDERVDWQPKFPQNVQRVSDETCYLLGKAIRAMKLK
jgi:hypothetical protein